MIAIVLGGFLLFAAVLVAVLLARPALAESRGGQVVTWLAIVVFPGLALALGTGHHLERAKTTDFCLSCHEMEPYGESLWIEDSAFLPASHFQNARVPRDRACYSCHSNYTMFGGVEAKLKGFKHLWIHYTGATPPPGEIELYDPYPNDICLHCHGRARVFLENELHDDLLADLRSGGSSCLDCHDLVHAVTELEGLDRWSP